MVKIELRIEEEQLEKFCEVCKLIGVEPDTKLKLMMENVVSTYWEDHKRREKNTNVIECGVQYLIPPAY